MLTFAWTCTIRGIHGWSCAVSSLPVARRRESPVAEVGRLSVPRQCPIQIEAADAASTDVASTCGLVPEGARLTWICPRRGPPYVTLMCPWRCNWPDKSEDHHTPLPASENRKFGNPSVRLKPAVSPQAECAPSAVRAPQAHTGSALDLRLPPGRPPSASLISFLYNRTPHPDKKRTHRCIHTHAHTCLHTCLHTSAHARWRAHTQAQARAYACTCTHTHARTLHSHSQNNYTYTNKHCCVSAVHSHRRSALPTHTFRSKSLADIRV